MLGTWITLGTWTTVDGEKHQLIYTYAPTRLDDNNNHEWYVEAARLGTGVEQPVSQLRNPLHPVDPQRQGMRSSLSNSRSNL